MKKLNMIVELFKIINERKLSKYLWIDFAMRIFIASQVFVSSSLYLDLMIEAFENKNYIFMLLITLGWSLFNLLFIILRYKFDLKVNGVVFYNLVLELRKDSLDRIWDNKNFDSPDEQFNYLGYNITDLAVMLFNVDKIIAYIIVTIFVYIWSIVISGALTGCIFILETVFLIFSIIFSKRQNFLNGEIFDKSSDLRNSHNDLYDASIDNLNNNISEIAIKYYKKKFDNLYNTKLKLAKIKTTVSNFEVILYSFAYISVMVLSLKINFISDKNLLIVIMSNYLILHYYMNLISNVIIDLSEKRYIIEQYNEIHSEFGFENKLIISSALKIKNLSLSINDNVILDDININVENNQKVALIGFNGAGKSSVIKCITNELINYTGEINLINNRIGFVDNKTNLLPVSIIQNINYGSIEEEVDFKNDNSYINIIKDIEHDLNEPLSDCEDSLSSGEQQRVAITRALFSKLDLIIADEPTSNLNKNMEKEVFEKIIQNSKALLFVTHNPEFVQYADYVYILDKGKIINHGSYKEVSLSEDYYRWSNMVVGGEK